MNIARFIVLGIAAAAISGLLVYALGLAWCAGRAEPAATECMAVVMLATLLAGMAGWLAVWIHMKLQPSSKEETA